MDLNQEISIISQAIYDKKGFNILVLDVRGVSSIVDYFIFAEGNVDRHVKAIAREIEDAMRKRGETPIHTDGMQHGEWIVLDYGDIFIHIFTPEKRDLYRIESVWSEGKVVDVPYASEEGA